MALEEEAELDALLEALARPEADAEYPLPEEKPSHEPDRRVGEEKKRLHPRN